MIVLLCRTIYHSGSELRLVCCWYVLMHNCPAAKTPTTSVNVEGADIPNNVNTKSDAK